MLTFTPQSKTRDSIWHLFELVYHTHTHSTKTWQHGVCIFHTASTILICENLHRSERKISLVEVIWKYHIAFHCWTAWSCVLHTFAAFPPSPSLGPRSFATRFRKGLVCQKLTTTLRLPTTASVPHPSSPGPQARAGGRPRRPDSRLPGAGRGPRRRTAAGRSARP